MKSEEFARELDWACSYLCSETVETSGWRWAQRPLYSCLHWHRQWVADGIGVPTQDRCQQYSACAIWVRHCRSSTL